MKVPSFLVLSLALVCAFVSSAPVEKVQEISSDDQKLDIAKREQEAIFYGNQQNEARMRRKKSDPTEAAADDTVDHAGIVQAVPAKPEDFIPQETEMEAAGDSAAQTASAPVQTEQAEVAPVEDTVVPAADNDVEEELANIGNAESAANEGDSQGEAQTAIVEEVEPPVEEVSDKAEEVVEPQQQQEGAEEEQTVENTGLVPTDDTEDEDWDYLKDFYLYMLADDRNRNYPYDSYPYRRRRSSRQSRAVTEGGMTHNALKRGKRIKRDLLDDVEGYYYPYQEEEVQEEDLEPVFEPQLTEEDLYDLYRPEPKYEDDVADLLAMYQQAPSSYDPYEAYEPSDLYPEPYQNPYEEMEEQYVPSKRQMMSTLPGMRRKRYFYPSNEEPETHWGAFIPEEKRDYEQTYRRLLALATALSEDSPYYYEDYRKK